MTPAPRHHRLLIVSLAVLILVGLDWAMSYLNPLTVLHVRGTAVSQVDRRTLHERILGFRQANGTISLGWSSHTRVDAILPPTKTRLICVDRDEPLPKDVPVPIRAPRIIGFDGFYERSPEFFGDGQMHMGASVPHWFLALLAGILPARAMWRTAHGREIGKV